MNLFNATELKRNNALEMLRLFQEMRHILFVCFLTLNIYTPGGTLSVHPDVSVDFDSELVSISCGCDCIFIVGLDSEKVLKPGCVVVRLHSGDAVFMSRSARFAWHGVPQVIGDSCQASLWDGLPSRVMGVHLRSARNPTKPSKVGCQANESS